METDANILDQWQLNIVDAGQARTAKGLLLDNVAHHQLE
jgi:hypothetical protein